MGNVLRFKNSRVPRQEGETCRLKVTRGPDQGVIFVVRGERATIGRGEQNDIMITDLKASRLHAEIAAGAGGWSIRDLGSSNGLLHNGRVSRSGVLRAGDMISLGETTFEFVPADMGTMMLVAPPRAPQEIEAEQRALDVRRESVRKAISFGGMKGAIGIPQVGGAMAAGGGGGGSFLSDPDKRKKALYVVVGLLFVWVMMDDGGGGGSSGNVARSPAAKTESQKRFDFSKYMPQGADTQAEKTAEMFFRMGFREFRERNYLRAKEQFETALQVSPGHYLSTLYLENAKQAIEGEIKHHLSRGKKAMDAGRLRESEGHFEAVLRLLHYNQSDPAFQEAREQLKKLKEKSGGTG